jgi:hypothetical protein
MISYICLVPYFVGLRITKAHWWRHFQNVGLINLATTFPLQVKTCSCFAFILKTFVGAKSKLVLSTTPWYHYICKASIWGGYSIPKALDNYILLFYTSFNRLLIFAEIKAPH